ncbi:hypothetical protein [uncultured Algibacter sp.]|uniref:hypothetical protein n=1 Tax=uncultured Algibacter sp. TaxID=298659 RepID=UPI002638AEA5|nr:hypothetical protein [uncultured Algibacter sp.]
MKMLIVLLALSFTSFCSAQFISEDDALHFGVGAVISSTTYSLVYSKTKNKKKAFWYSLGMSTLAGLSKEIYDGFIIDGRFDTGEMIATSLGGLTASTTLHLFVGKKNNQKLENIALVN